MDRVLYLDDELDLAESIPLLLRAHGLDVTGTTSIAEALQLFADRDFDAVLLDIMMPPTPDMDARSLDYGRKTGVEIVRRMKKIKPEVPIVAFTVLTEPAGLDELRLAGVSSIINKPTEVDAIAHALRQVIRKVDRRADKNVSDSHQ